MTPTSVLLTLGTVQAAFLMISLFRRNFENRKSNMFLVILLFAITSFFVYGLSENLGHFLGLKLILKINSIAIALLIGPSFFLYVKSLFLVEKLNWKATSYHFLPYLTLLVILSTIELISGMIGFLPPNESQLFVYFIEAFKSVHLTTYLVLSTSILFQLKNSKKIEYHGNSKQILFWLKFLLLTFILSVLGSLTFFIWAKFINTQANLDTPTYLIILLVLIVYAIAYMAVRFPLFVSKVDEVLVFEGPAKYQTSSLRDIDKQRILELVKREMEINQPYLHEDLMIESIAEKLEIPVHHLSQTINELCKKSFNSFINEFRVEEFKKRISDDTNSNKTILAIAYESGFASKSSFNRIFKAHTGLTPNEYKKGIK